MAPELLRKHRGFGYEVYERPNGTWRWVVLANAEIAEILRIGETSSNADAIEACKDAIDAMLNIRDSGI